VKILVVEDDAKLARILVRTLAEEGHAADVAADGVTAVSQALAIGYDVVLLDRMLPKLDGLEVCRALRAKGMSVPILMLTARAEVADRIEGLEAGADDYLCKPFDLRELVARIRVLARRGAAGVLRVGPLVIVRAEQRVSLDGERLDLAPREYALLEYLARNAARVVPRSELLSRVWLTSFDNGSNVIEVQVAKVRAKLGRYAGLIATVRGFGYRLDVDAAGPAEGGSQADP
jgi:two-component system OmpR family response regulator